MTLGFAIPYGFGQPHRRKVSCLLRYDFRLRGAAVTNGQKETNDNLRMNDRQRAPTAKALAAWLGPDAYEQWKKVANWIAASYPDVFAPEWLFGGTKHGWSLRYKKSKSFCTFVPEKGRFQLLIVFGAEDRAKVEAIRATLSPAIRQRYDEATTYHDGKWLLITIADKVAITDAQRLLTAKRKPKASTGDEP